VVAGIEALLEPVKTSEQTHDDSVKGVIVTGAVRLSPRAHCFDPVAGFYLAVECTEKGL
jgi:hypothetical protein